MPDEPTSSKQDIAAGDASQNYQAARDVHIHNHTHAAPAEKRSSIVQPTLNQIAEFDPQTRKIIDTARAASGIYFTRKSIEEIIEGNSQYLVRFPIMHLFIFVLIIAATVAAVAVIFKLLYYKIYM